MELDTEACYRALKTRDRRFDGRFFTGVTSTGVYCRPICPAPTPKPVNCRFFRCAAAAQEAGFRPCLRCRPEIAPAAPAAHGTSATVSRALRLIAEGALDDASVDGFAATLGVGARHLRRLFDEHLGASPLAVAATRRCLFAKQLLAETSLSITDVAFASGFSSVRRFNAAMLDACGRPPRDLRRATAATRAAGAIVITLPYRAPYNWNGVVEFLAPRAIPGVEQITPESYRRVLPGGFVEVRPVPGYDHLQARFELTSIRDLARMAARLANLFDTEAPIAEIERHLSQSPRLAPAIRAKSGLRVPGAWDPFELTVRAILGQQVTVKGATTLAGRLVERFGEATPHGYLFPAPAVLAAADPSGVGLPSARGAALRAVAEAFASPNPPRTAAELLPLRGIGDWTAQYVAMRAFRDPDAFPGTDLGLIHAAGRDVAQQSIAWRPWRAYAAMHLWLEQTA
ncbi:MAG TPA: AlkA N-terminal domain-containing protein [Candidatus Limnocylindrales bacterium]|nr:AlkA N-terminal domain-containing protein [Candidatus Limnocylindrales bacterium]